MYHGQAFQSAQAAWDGMLPDEDDIYLEEWIENYEFSIEERGEAFDDTIGEVLRILTDDLVPQDAAWMKKFDDGDEFLNEKEIEQAISFVQRLGSFTDTIQQYYCKLDEIAKNSYPS